MLKILVTYTVLCFALKANALIVDFGTNLSLGNFNHTTSQTNNTTVTNLGIFANLARSEFSNRLHIGWYVMSYEGQATFPSGNVNQTLTSNDMGPAVRWDIDRNSRYSITAMYGVICKGSLNSSGSSESLTGESILIKFTIEPQLTERLYFGGSINYYSATYNTSVIGTTQSNVSYQNNYIFPSLSLSFRY